MSCFRIGDDLMICLLTECSIFVNIPESNSLLQIAGKPITEESIKVPNSIIVNPIKTTSKTYIYINRTRIMYGRSICADNFKIIGLPFNRKILNLC